MSSQTFAGQTAGLVRDIWRTYGWMMVALVLVMAVAALVEGLGMVLLLPFLSAIGVAGAPDTGGLSALVNSSLAILGLDVSAYRIAATLLVVFAAQMLLSVAQQWWVSWLQRDYGARWQNRLFDVLIHARWGFLAEQKLGNLTNLIALETFRLAGAFMVLTQLAAMLVVAVVYLAVAVTIAWQVTILMVVLGGALFLMVRGISRKNFHVGMRLGPLSSDLNVLLTEYFGGVKLIKATATEHVAATRVGRVVEEMRVQHTWATFLPSLVRAIFEFTAIAALCFILVFAYQRLAIPAANVLVVLALFVRLLPRFNALQQNMQSLATYVPAFSVAQDMVISAEAASERDRAGVLAVSQPMVGPLTIAIARGGYRGVTTLRDVVLRLPERGLVGIVGESGAGKSTLVHCLLGLADIHEGTVSFGDVKMTDVPLKVWRRRIGFVPQDPVLFHLSIRDNIAWGLPTATDDDIHRAARQALAHDFILEQPQGYNTIVGDQGARLSGGQRQRLSIARALLGNPAMLVLDEATNALDLASEALVLETVDRLRGDICVVMVAHRLSTVRAADVIVVLEKGRVVETGGWNDLVAQHGVLSRLVATAQ